jgi:hypothetical protein
LNGKIEISDAVAWTGILLQDTTGSNSGTASVRQQKAKPQRTIIYPFQHLGHKAEIKILIGQGSEPSSTAEKLWRSIGENTDLESDDLLRISRCG